jgi:hypothetical protein
MCNRVSSLSPKPSSGEGKSRFRGQVGEFLEHVSGKRFSFYAGGEEMDQPYGNARRMNERCWRGHE